MLAGGDPAKTARTVGTAWEAIGVALPILERAFRIKERKIAVYPDFTASKTDLEAEVAIRLRVGGVVWMLLKYAWKAREASCASKASEKKNGADRKNRNLRKSKNEEKVVSIMNNNISEMLTSSMEKIQKMVDVNTIIGQPVHLGDGVTIVPITKVHIGVGGGGTDFATKSALSAKKDPFGGGLGAGVSVDPVAFLIVKDGTVRMLPVASPPAPPWTASWSRRPI